MIWTRINATHSLKPCFLPTLKLSTFPMYALFQISVSLLVAFSLPLMSFFFLYCETISLMFFFKGSMCVTVFSRCSRNIYSVLHTYTQSYLLLFVFILVYDQATTSGNILGTQELVTFLSCHLLFLMLKKGWEAACLVTPMRMFQFCNILSFPHRESGEKVLKGNY